MAFLINLKEFEECGTEDCLTFCLFTSHNLILFFEEIEKTVKDPVTRAEVVKTVMEFEYEPNLEPKYRSDLVKTFKKNVENGYFPFIIVDCVNDQVRHFEDMVTFATQRRFQVSQINH